MRLNTFPLITALSLVMITAACGTSDSADSSDESFKPGSVEMVIPFSPGGGVDLAGRTIAQNLNDVGAVDQAMQITNLPGGSGGIGMNKMEGAYAGNDDVLMTIATHVLTTPIQQGQKFDIANMTPLARMYSEFGLVAVAADSPLKTMSDLGDALEADPKAIKIGGGSAGSVDEILARSVGQAVGLSPNDLIYIPYDGGEAVAALLGGNLDVMVGGFDFLGLIEAGEIRALGVAAPEQLSGPLADVPTLKDQGFDIELANWRGVFGPKDMPQAAESYWKNELKKVSESKAWKSFLEKNGFVDDFQADGFSEFIESQDTVFRKALDKAGS